MLKRKGEQGQLGPGPLRDVAAAAAAAAIAAATTATIAPTAAGTAGTEAAAQGPAASRAVELGGEDAREVVEQEGHREG